jgi:hypothetical protein
MNQFGVTKIVSKQSILLKIKTKNCLAKFTKPQECGAKRWKCGVSIFTAFFQRTFNLTKY